MLRQYTSICVLPQHDQNSSQSTGIGKPSQTNAKSCPLFFFVASGHSDIFASSMSMIEFTAVGFQRQQENLTCFVTR